MRKCRVELNDSIINCKSHTRVLSRLAIAIPAGYRMKHRFAMLAYTNLVYYEYKIELSRNQSKIELSVILLPLGSNAEANMLRDSSRSSHKNANYGEDIQSLPHWMKATLVNGLRA